MLRMVSRFVSGSRVAVIGLALALSPAPLAAQARDCDRFEEELFTLAMAYQRGARTSAMLETAPTTAHGIAIISLSRETRFYVRSYQERYARSFAVRFRDFCYPLRHDR